MNYIIVQHGKRFVLKQIISPNFYGSALFFSNNIEKVKTFAKDNNLKIQ